MLAAVCLAGCLLSAAAACGLLHPLVFAGTWLMYLSFKSLGGDFVDYGWVSVCVLVDCDTDQLVLYHQWSGFWQALCTWCTFGNKAVGAFAHACL